MNGKCTLVMFSSLFYTYKIANIRAARYLEMIENYSHIAMVCNILILQKVMYFQTFRFIFCVHNAHVDVLVFFFLQFSYNLFLIL